MEQNFWEHGNSVKVNLGEHLNLFLRNMGTTVNLHREQAPPWEALTCFPPSYDFEHPSAPCIEQNRRWGCDDRSGALSGHTLTQHFNTMAYLYSKAQSNVLALETEVTLLQVVLVLK